MHCLFRQVHSLAIRQARGGSVMTVAIGATVGAGFCVRRHEAAGRSAKSAMERGWHRCSMSRVYCPPDQVWWARQQCMRFPPNATSTTLAPPPSTPSKQNLITNRDCWYPCERRWHCSGGGCNAKAARLACYIALQGSRAPWQSHRGAQFAKTKAHVACAFLVL
jgi:hypothetical protein